MRKKVELVLWMTGGAVTGVAAVLAYMALFGSLQFDFFSLTLTFGGKAVVSFSVGALVFAFEGAVLGSLSAPLWRKMSGFWLRAASVICGVAIGLFCLWGQLQLLSALHSRADFRLIPAYLLCAGSLGMWSFVLIISACLTPSKRQTFELDAPEQESRTPLS